MSKYKSLLLAIAFLAFCWFAFHEVDSSYMVERAKRIEELEKELVESQADLQIRNSEKQKIKETLFLLYPEDKDKITNMFHTIAENYENNNDETTEEDNDETTEEDNSENDTAEGEVKEKNAPTTDSEG